MKIVLSLLRRRKTTKRQQSKKITTTDTTNGNCLSFGTTITKKIIYDREKQQRKKKPHYSLVFQTKFIKFERSTKDNRHHQAHHQYRKGKTKTLTNKQKIITTKIAQKS